MPRCQRMRRRRRRCAARGSDARRFGDRERRGRPASGVRRERGGAPVGEELCAGSGANCEVAAIAGPAGASSFPLRDSGAPCGTALAWVDRGRRSVSAMAPLARLRPCKRRPSANPSSVCGREPSPAPIRPLGTTWRGSPSPACRTESGSSEGARPSRSPASSSAVGVFGRPTRSIAVLASTKLGPPGSTWAWADRVCDRGRRSATALPGNRQRPWPGLHAVTSPQRDWHAPLGSTDTSLPRREACKSATGPRTQARGQAASELTVSSSSGELAPARCAGGAAAARVCRWEECGARKGACVRRRGKERVAVWRWTAEPPIARHSSARPAFGRDIEVFAAVSALAHRWGSG